MNALKSGIHSKRLQAYAKALAEATNHANLDEGIKLEVCLFRALINHLISCTPYIDEVTTLAQVTNSVGANLLRISHLLELTQEGDDIATALQEALRQVNKEMDLK